MCVYLLIYLPVTSNVRTKYFEHKIFNDKNYFYDFFMVSLYVYKFYGFFNM